MMQQPMTRDERSIGDLFSELANETGTLIRQEVSLAQAEMTKKATEAGKNAASIAIVDLSDIPRFWRCWPRSSRSCHMRCRSGCPL
jgi:formylmethanofuran dehydrogenase subunit B